jgi:hypothetical protein
MNFFGTKLWFETYNYLLRIKNGEALVNQRFDESIHFSHYFFAAS